MTPVPRLKLTPTVWTLQGYPSPFREWSPRQKILAVQKAGFDGVVVRSNSPVVPEAQAAKVMMVGNVDIGKVKDVRKKLGAFKELGIFHINVQLCDHDTPTKKALPVTLAIMREGARLGVQPVIEVHRDTCTETPEKAYALADAYRRKTGKLLRMNFDHSHPAIIKHLVPSKYWERLVDRPELLALGNLIHFRPFNGHHCQVPITDGRGRHSPEFKDWLPFCERVIQFWLERNPRATELVVVPELGPLASGYKLSCFPDVWKDCQVLGHEIRRIWKKALQSRKK